MSLGQSGQIEVEPIRLQHRRVVIAERDPRARERLRHTLHEMGLDIAGLAVDGQEAVQLAAKLSPDYVLLDEELAIMDAYAASAAIRATTPDAAPIILSANMTPEVYRKAMQYGARDVLRKPLDVMELRGTLQSLTDIHRSQQTADFRQLMDPEHLPSVYVVTGGKGGVGKTMIAANLALCLRERDPKTVLVDLYTQFGDVASVMNLEPRRTLAELTSMTEDIDWSLLSSYVHKHQSGLHTMFTSNRPLALDALSVVVLDRVISVLKREYKYIVFDVPPYLHAVTLHAMSVATSVILVCNLFDYSTIADTKALFDTLDGAYVSRDRLKLVVNRVTEQNGFKVEDLEKTFGHPVFASIPNEPRVVNLLNTGYTGHSAIANLPLGQAVRNLMDLLSAPDVPLRYEADVEPQGATRKPGLITRWKSVFSGASA